MTVAELIQTELTRLHTMLTKSIEGLTGAQLHAVPGGHPTANTIAWGLWHVVRTEDNVVRFVLQNRRTPVWTEDGYAEKLGLPPVAQGTGMSAADAHALRLDNLDLFREYMGKVWASSDEFVKGLDPAALDRAVTIKPLGDMTVGRALAQVCVAHGFMHVGEIELARTLVGGSVA
ncbi:MAG TPA: DinB family protein [Terriglobales bacterium]|nr:DinB family protein [Terriglobales bacterium]